MNAMAKMAAQENARAKRTWNMGGLDERVGAVVPVLIRAGVPTAAAEIMTEITKAICEKTGVTADDILRYCRKPAIVRARQLCMWEARQAGIACTDVGDFYQRSHTNVLHAERAVNKLLEVAQ